MRRRSCASMQENLSTGFSCLDPVATGNVFLVLTTNAIRRVGGRIVAVYVTAQNLKVLKITFLSTDHVLEGTEPI